MGIHKNTQTRKIREETLPTVYGKTLFYSSRPGSMDRKTKHRVCFNGTVWDIYLPATRLLADETYGNIRNMRPQAHHPLSASGEVLHFSILAMPKNRSR